MPPGVEVSERDPGLLGGRGLSLIRPRPVSPRRSDLGIEQGTGTIRRVTDARRARCAADRRPWLQPKLRPKSSSERRRRFDLPDVPAGEADQLPELQVAVGPAAKDQPPRSAGGTALGRSPVPHTIRIDPLHRLLKTPPARAASGLNDLDSTAGQTISQVQTAADSWKHYGLPKGSPGTLGLCRGGSGEG